MFILQFATGGQWTNRFAFSPAVGALQPYRFITSAFLHSTGFIVHILFNMMAFWQCGNLLERVLGHGRFLALCLVSALGGSVVYLLLAGGPGGANWGTPVVGASGMVFGLFGALIPIMRRAGNSIRQMIGLIAINAVLGVVVPGIAWQAHLGGLLIGLLMSWAYTHIGVNRRQLPAAASSRNNSGRLAVNVQSLVAWVLPLALTGLLVAAAYLTYQTTGWLEIVRQFRGL
jgi:membrane associated rhomboid family serine protease